MLRKSDIIHKGDLKDAVLSQNLWEPTEDYGGVLNNPDPASG